jgi:ABC-type glycerol-3-phosphate transport system substrate-binding protein
MSATQRKQLNRRDFLKIAGGFAGGALLAACGPAPTPQTVEVEKVVEKTVEVEKVVEKTVEVEKVVEKVVTATPAVKEPVTLKLWVTDRRTINNMTKNFMMPDFMGRYPYITVESEFMPEQDLMTKLNTTALAGEPPDIASIDEQSLHILITQNLLQPIPDDLVDVPQEMGSRIATWYKLPVGDPNGKYYALPNGTMTSGLYYNQGLLEQHGYTWEDIPKKWDDFIKWAQELTIWEGDEIKQAGFAFNQQEYAVQQSAMYQQGGFYFKSDKELAIRDQVVLDSYQFMLDFYDKYKLDSRTSPLCRDLFTLGQAVTCCSWTWWNGFLTEQFPNLTWGTVPWPTFTGEPPYTRADDDVGFVVATQSDDPNHLDAAWTLWRFLVGPDYQRQYCVLRGVQPALFSMRGEEQFAEQNPQWRAVATTMQPGNYISEGIWAKELDDIVKTTHSAVLGGTPIQEAIEQVAQQMEAVMPTLEQPLLWGKDGWAAHPEWRQM